jgi:enoyl-CoA hydratase
VAETLQVTREGAVSVVALNRPSRLNALDLATLDAISETMATIGRDAAVRAVILTGGAVFSAGADLKEMAAWSPDEMRRHARRGQQVCHAIERLGKPVIAAVRGLALGGGCELAAACHLRLAADDASFGQPEIELGLIPGFGGTQRLARLIGRAGALDLLLTGRRVTAGEALRLGLVHRVVPAAALLDEAKILAAGLAAKAPVAMRYILDAVHDGSDAPLDAALALEATLFGLVAASGDRREGVQAFLEKRTPDFKGE